ncbi:MAG TPA: hypothetical protein VIG06_19560 [Kofleriaceae bacterium]
MRVSMLLLVVLALAGGCSSNETVKRVKGLADRACACTDATCADAVEKEYLDLVKEGQKRGTEDDRTEVAEAYSRMRDCIASARTGEKAPAAAEQADKAAPP